LGACALIFSSYASARDRTSAYVAPLGYELTECVGTGSKPQSKLWYQDESFWCILDTPDGNQFLELVGHQWQFRQVLSESPFSVKGQSDVLWDGEHLVVVVHADPSLLFEFDYDEVARQYVLRSGFPLCIDLASNSETLVIEKDSTGRLWVAYSADGTVYAE
jgi:hypothetical protein